jgi:hypothetical protein
MKLLIVVFLIFSFQGFAFSADKDIVKPPHFYLQGSLGNNSGLAMSCDGEPPFNEIECLFTMVSIRSVSHETTVNNKKESASEMKKVEQKDIDGFKEIDLNKISQNMKAASIEQKAFMQDSLKLFTTMKNVKDTDSLTMAMNDFLDLQGATCTISQKTFYRHFTRVSKNKWLFNPGPEGLCKVVRIATLENRPEYPELWTYTETVVTADQDKTCKEWSEVGNTYVSSWDSPKSFKFEHCKYIEFGF